MATDGKYVLPCMCNAIYEWSEEIAEREIEKLKCRLAWIMWEWKLGQGKGLTLRILTAMCTSNQTINIKPTACAPSFTSFTHTKPLKFYHFMGLLKKSTWHRVYIFLYQYHHHCSQSFTILLKKKRRFGSVNVSFRNTVKCSIFWLLSEMTNKQQAWVKSY